MSRIGKMPIVVPADCKVEIVPIEASRAFAGKVNAESRREAASANRTKRKRPRPFVLVMVLTPPLFVFFLPPFPLF